MAGKTLIGGTSYTVSGGKTLVGGTAYSISKGKTLVGGTWYDISFASGAIINYSSNVDNSTHYLVVNGSRIHLTNAHASSVVVEPNTYIAVQNLNSTTNWRKIYLGQTTASTQISHYTDTDTPSVTSCFKVTEGITTVRGSSSSGVFVYGQVEESTTTNVSITWSGSTSVGDSYFYWRIVGTSYAVSKSSATIAYRLGVPFEMYANNGITINGTSIGKSVNFQIIGRTSITVTVSGSVLSRKVSVAITGDVSVFS